MKLTSILFRKNDLNRATQAVNSNGLNALDEKIANSYSNVFGKDHWFYGNSWVKNLGTDAIKTTFQALEKTKAIDTLINSEEFGFNLYANSCPMTNFQKKIGAYVDLRINALKNTTSLTDTEIKFVFLNFKKFQKKLKSEQTVSPKFAKHFIKKFDKDINNRNNAIDAIKTYNENLAEKVFTPYTKLYLISDVSEALSVLSSEELKILNAKLSKVSNPKGYILSNSQIQTNKEILNKLKVLLIPNLMKKSPLMVKIDAIQKICESEPDFIQKNFSNEKGELLTLLTRKYIDPLASSSSES